MTSRKNGIRKTRKSFPHLYFLRWFLNSKNAFVHYLHNQKSQMFASVIGMLQIISKCILLLIIIHLSISNAKQIQKSYE